MKQTPRNHGRQHARTYYITYHMQQLTAILGFRQPCSRAPLYSNMISMTDGTVDDVGSHHFCMDHVGSALRNARSKKRNLAGITTRWGAGLQAAVVLVEIQIVTSTSR